MKLNLVLDEAAASIDDHANVLVSQIDNIAAHTCTSVILNGTLNYLTDEELGIVLGKVRHGGTVSIASPDAIEIAHALCWDNIDLNTFSTLTSQRLRQCTLSEVRKLFEQREYKIAAASINNLFFHIRAVRP